MLFSDIQAVIFDLDGTLVDSMWMWRRIDIDYLAEFGLTIPDLLQEAIEGMSFSETAAYFKETFRIPKTEEEIKTDWLAMSLDKYLHEVPMKPGSRELVDHLRMRKLKLGIATSSSHPLVEAVSAAHGLKGMFDSIRTCCEVEHGKPAPDIYLKVADDLDVEPAHCLVFEDAVQGILSAKNAGMRVCAIYDPSSRQQEERKRSLADAYIDSFEQLLVTFPQDS